LVSDQHLIVIRSPGIHGDQVQAWSRSFTLPVPVICCTSYNWWLIGHLATVINLYSAAAAAACYTVGRMGAVTASAASCASWEEIKRWLNSRRTQQWVVEGRGTGMYHINRRKVDCEVTACVDTPTLTVIKSFSIATNNLLRKTFVWLPNTSEMYCWCAEIGLHKRSSVSHWVALATL